MPAGILLFFGFLYFTQIRPENKRRKELEDSIESMKKGTKVRTAGGILGEVVSVNKDDVVVQIARDAQAEPLDSASSGTAIMSDWLSMPSKETCRLPGTRRSGSPLSTTPSSSPVIRTVHCARSSAC